MYAMQELSTKALVSLPVASGDMIFIGGNPARHMYLIIQGEFTYYHEKGRATQLHGRLDRSLSQMFSPLGSWAAFGTWVFLEIGSGPLSFWAYPNAILRISHIPSLDVLHQGDAGWGGWLDSRNGALDSLGVLG